MSDLDFGCPCDMNTCFRKLQVIASLELTMTSRSSHLEFVSNSRRVELRSTLKVDGVKVQKVFKILGVFFFFFFLARIKAGGMLFRQGVPYGDLIDIDRGNPIQRFKWSMPNFYDCIPRRLEYLIPEKHNHESNPKNTRIF